MNPYDALPYTAWVQPYTCPARIAAVASLHGLVPYDTATARVLEIGCADGTNLIAMATARPGLRCVGVDYSAVQIEAGRKVVDGIGANNVDLRVASIEAIDASYGEFDLIVCHGVWSWVSPAMRAAILRVCAERLAPSGIAYVSYNTLPGWYSRLPFRDAMLAAAGDGTPLSRVQRGRALIDAIAQHAPEHTGEWRARAQKQKERFEGYPDEYLFHEYLAEYNEPVYFKDFVKQSEDAGLAWLGEAELHLDMVGEPYPGAPGDRIGDEQHADYFRNMGFRKSLLVKKGVATRRTLASGIDALSFMGRFSTPDGEPADLTQGVGVAYAGRNEQPLMTDLALLKGAVAVLTDAFPCSVSFPDLVDLARERVGDEPNPNDTQRLREELFQCFAAGVLDAWVGDDAFAAEISNRPVASAFARWHAAKSPWVPTLRHDGTKLTDFARFLLPLLDGEHDGAAMVRAVSRAVVDGKLALEGSEGLALDDPQLEEPAGQATLVAMEAIYEASLNNHTPVPVPGRPGSRATSPA